MTPIKHISSDPWPTPFDPKVLGLLRPLINQYSDGASTILTPRKDPSQDVDYPVAITTTTEAPVCIPVAFGGGGFNQSPLKDPYEVGDVVTISLVAPPTGTEPISYQWYVNGDPRDTTEAFVYTVASADVLGQVGDFGFIYIWLTISNACGSASSSVLTINVYNPPPP